MEIINETFNKWIELWAMLGNRVDSRWMFKQGKVDEVVRSSGTVDEKYRPGN